MWMFRGVRVGVEDCGIEVFIVFVSLGWFYLVFVFVIGYVLVNFILIKFRY